MVRKLSLMLVLGLGAVWLNLHPLRVFFDQQLMLGSSLAVLALLLLGWRGIAVGVAAYLVTWHSWGHPFELINGTCWLLVVQLFLTRFNGGAGQRGNGRLVLATVAYWLLIGLPAEWLWFHVGLGLAGSQALGLGLKELVTAVLNASLGLFCFQGLLLLNPRQRRRGLLSRGLTFSTLLLAITVPGMLICMVVSTQLSNQALLTHREFMQNLGRDVAELGQIRTIPDRLVGVAVQVQAPADRQHLQRVLFSTDSALFGRLARDYQRDRRSLGRVEGLQLLVPQQQLPTLIANQRSYWQTELRRGDQLITVVQPAQHLLNTMAFNDLLPSFVVVVLLLVGGALVSELFGSMIHREFEGVLELLNPSLACSGSRHPSFSLIREMQVLGQSIQRTTTELQEATQRYRNFFNLPLVGTAITSVSKGWVEVNDQTCELLGYTRDELFESNWAELTHPDDLGADTVQFERMLRREIDGYQIEKRFIRKDGTIVHTLLAGGCGAIGPQPVDLCYVNIIDISERKRVAAELVAVHRRQVRNVQQNRELLEQKLKTSLTAAAVVHEIQQPLAAILLNCRLALQCLPGLTAGAPAPELEARLRSLTADGDRVVTTMERMRMLLRNVETEHTTIDLSACLHSALVFAQTELQQHQVQFSSQGLEQSCLLQGDGAQLQIAVVNLIRNAIQAMQVQPQASRRLLLELQRHPDGFEIVVADSGPGFPEGYRNDTSWDLLRSTKASGMGIGLFVVQTAANNHQGHLRFGRSAPLGGAEVVISLPVADAAVADAAEVEAVKATSNGG